MPVNRYYSHQDFQEGILVFLEDLEFHHLIHVMRQDIDDEIEIVNGRGQLGIAKIVKIEKKGSSLKILNIKEAPQIDEPLILAQAIPRLNKLEFILEKGIELGMTEIWLFPSKHSEKSSFSPHQSDRLKSISISAMKQCGRLFLPEMIIMPPLEQWQKFSLPAFFGDTRPFAPPLTDKWELLKNRSGSVFCVGPESGFTFDEINLLQELGAQGVKLTSHILRTETAAISALSIMSQWQLYKNKPSLTNKENNIL